MSSRKAGRKLLFHLSDIHFGLEDNHALDWVKQEIAERRPDAVAITGDLTMRARRREFDAATRWITTLGVPVTVEVGNHDMPYFNPIERFFTPYKRFQGNGSAGGAGDRLVRPRHRAAQDRGARATPVELVQGLGDTKGRLDKTSGLRSMRCLQGDKARWSRCTIPCAKSVRKEPRIDAYMAARRLAELAKRPVAAVISGHVHDAFDIMEDTANGPVRMIGAGTLVETHALHSTQFQ